MNHYLATTMKFFKDKDGHIAIIQWPNIPLIGWFVSMLAALFITSPQWHTFLGYLGFGFIFTWAWLEITTGFRRTAGVVVLLLALYAHI
jgi:hypothetical protein